MWNPFNQTKSEQDHYAQGVKFGLAGKYAKAASELAKAVTDHPDLVLAQVSLGVALHKIGDHERALKHFEIALELSPRDAEAHYFRANVFYAQKSMSQAIAGYTIAVGIQPALIKAHHEKLPQDRLTDYNRAPFDMYWIRKPAYRILESSEKLAQNVPQAEVYVTRGTAYFELWNYEQAIADYTKSIEINANDAKVWHYRGLAFEQIEQYELALKDYAHVIELDPLFEDAFINQGTTYGKMGDYPRAIASFSRGIEIKPDDPNGYFNRGNAYFRTNEFDKAIEDFSEVIKISPQDEGAYFWRAQAHEKKGDLKRAIEDYEYFIKMPTNTPIKAEAKKRLAELKEAG
jgi:tetratricopeptide (TPR) repeat protein